MSPDHYETLGIERDAGSREIHEAYRRAAKEHHPDTSGGTDNERFRAVQEAYETLRDGERKRSYDRGLDVHVPVRHAPPPSTRRAQPFGLRAQASLVRRLDVELSALEAEWGGVLPLDIPVEYPCPFCGDFPLSLGFCPACGGSGFQRSSVPVDVELPPGLRDGSSFTIHVDTGDGQAADVLVTVLVDPS